MFSLRYFALQKQLSPAKTALKLAVRALIGQLSSAACFSSSPTPSAFLVPLPPLSTFHHQKATPRMDRHDRSDLLMLFRRGFCSSLFPQYPCLPIRFLLSVSGKDVSSGKPPCRTVSIVTSRHSMPWLSPLAGSNYSTKALALHLVDSSRGSCRLGHLTTTRPG
jgi:hypothetical protein